LEASQSPGSPKDAAFRPPRVLPHRLDRVFEAFARPDLLARWWGPDGFTSTVEAFELAPGGRWKFVTPVEPANEQNLDRLQSLLSDP